MFADLTNADLRFCRLENAELLLACLEHADMRGANLTGADLENAFLSGADLRNVVLKNTKLQMATYDGATQWPKGVDPKKMGAILDPGRKGPAYKGGFGLR